MPLLNKYQENYQRILSLICGIHKPFAYPGDIGSFTSPHSSLFLNVTGRDQGQRPCYLTLSFYRPFLDGHCGPDPEIEIELRHDNETAVAFSWLSESGFLQASLNKCLYDPVILLDINEKLALWLINFKQEGFYIQDAKAIFHG